MNSTVRLAALALAACFATSTFARECPKAPVWNSQQAVCYATIYAKGHELRHERPLMPKVAKTSKAWTVRFFDVRRDVRGGGWEVDVDVATGTVTRFKSYKEIER
jgi:hypothetical protein